MFKNNPGMPQLNFFIGAVLGAVGSAFFGKKSEKRARSAAQSSLPDAPAYNESPLRRDMSGPGSGSMQSFYNTQAMLENAAREDLAGGSAAGKDAISRQMAGRFDEAYGQARDELMRRGVYSSGIHGDWASKIARNVGDFGASADLSRRQSALGTLAGVSGRALTGSESAWRRAFDRSKSQDDAIMRRYEAQYSKAGDVNRAAEAGRSRGASSGSMLGNLAGRALDKLF